MPPCAVACIVSITARALCPRAAAATSTIVRVEAVPPTRRLANGERVIASNGALRSPKVEPTIAHAT
jgi:hypothetical protein